MTDWQMSPAGLYVPPAAADGAYLPRKAGARFADFLRLVNGTGTTVNIDPTTGEVAIDAPGSGAIVQSVVAGTNVTVDNTDPANPIISAAGGGATSAWDHTVSLPLSTLTGWTAGAGTWSIVSGVINQSNSTNNNASRYCHFNTVLPLTQLIAQVECKMNTATSTTLSRMGIIFGTPPAADGTGGDNFVFKTNGSTAQVAQVHSEREGLSAWIDVSLASVIANGTWATLKVWKVGRDFSIWVNGSLLATIEGQANATNLGRFALYSSNSDCSFRNLDIWTPTLP